MPFIIINLIYFGLAVLVATLGKHRKFGAWGYFFASLLLTPFVGLLLVMASDPRYMTGELESHRGSPAPRPGAVTADEPAVVAPKQI